MSTQGEHRQQSRILFVKNLNYTVTGDELYELFGKYGAIRQIRIGTNDSGAQKTKGTAFVVYEEFGDAKMALERLNGFHLKERYIVVLYHVPSKAAAKADLARREAELEELKRRHNIQDED